MNRFYRFLLMLAVVLLITIGCTSKDPIREDLINYINNELLPIANLEKEAAEAYESVTGSNYKDDIQLYNTVNEVVIPKYREFVEKLEAIQPKTEEIRKLHELYIEAANIQFNAFNLILSAVENQDRNLVVQANEKLEQGRKLLREFNYQLEELAKKHNVEFELDKN